MHAQITHSTGTFTVDLNRGIDLSISIDANRGARAWYVDLPEIEPVMSEHFTGSVAQGGSVNFRNVFFNPHGNGTHTECVGHIAQEVHSVNKNLDRYFFVAQLISVEPKPIASPFEADKTDQIIDKDLLEGQILEGTEALIIRTLPNSASKTTLDYSNKNAPYFTEEAMRYIVEMGIDHLLVDLPSVDRESDGGALACHHIFWEYPHQTRFHKTITEFIFAEDAVTDGRYLLNLQVAALENDASPSRPVIFPIISEGP